MHVYQALLKKYGETVIGPTSWVSENSQYHFPENAVDDGMGCDFQIQLNGKTYLLEVKSTSGDDESFKLGSSETRLAIQTAGKRKQKFKILHVREALSQAPILSVLPNPYDRSSKEKFLFEDAGMRVRYRSSSVDIQS